MKIIKYGEVVLDSGIKYRALIEFNYESEFQEWLVKQNNKTTAEKMRDEIKEIKKEMRK